MTGQTNANGSTVSNTYDSANRTTETKHKNSTGTTLADYQYSYDGVNNVTTRTDTNGTVTTFRYEATDQLTCEPDDRADKRERYRHVRLHDVPYRAYSQERHARFV